MIENRKDDILEKLVHINRITKVVKGGRRFGFSALVVVGNQNGKIGIAHAKAKQVPDAIKKATEVAKRNLIKIPKILTPKDVAPFSDAGLTAYRVVKKATHCAFCRVCRNCY